MRDHTVTCEGCGLAKATANVLGRNICFDCLEPAYQVLAAIKSQEIAERGQTIEVNHIGVYSVRPGGIGK